MMSNMDPVLAVQGTELRGIPIKYLGVAWGSNGDMMVCYMMNEGSRVENASSKIQLQSSVQKES